MQRRPGRLSRKAKSCKNIGNSYENRDFDDATDAPDGAETETPKSRGLEGVEKLSISFHVPCQNMSISGRRKPRAHLGGFRARPARAQPMGRASRAERRTGRATPSRAIRRRATARQASGDVARGLAASNAGRDSSGSSRRPARRRTTKLFFKTSPAREPFRNPILQTHDRQEVHLGFLKILLRIPDATSERRPRTRDL